MKQMLSAHVRVIYNEPWLYDWNVTSMGELAYFWLIQILNPQLQQYSAAINEDQQRWTLFNTLACFLVCW